MPPKSLLSTAVLVFAYSPSEEMAHKHIPKAGALYTELTEQTLRKIDKSGLSYFHFTEHEQSGSTFGERFSNAIQFVFDHGFDNVITIGNDTPLLTASHIQRASICLDRGEFVMGPSTDGGFYLMGLHKSQFHVDKFKNLPWQTNRTATAVLTVIRENKTKIVQLEILSDIDGIEDLKNILKFKSKLTPQLAALIIFIIGQEDPRIVFNLMGASQAFGQRIYNKGSPLLAVI